MKERMHIFGVCLLFCLIFPSAAVSKTPFDHRTPLTCKADKYSLIFDTREVAELFIDTGLVNDLEARKKLLKQKAIHHVREGSTMYITPAHVSQKEDKAFKSDFSSAGKADIYRVRLKGDTFYSYALRMAFVCEGEEYEEVDKTDNPKFNDTKDPDKAFKDTKDPKEPESADKDFDKEPKKKETPSKKLTPREIEKQMLESSINLD